MNKHVHIKQADEFTCVIFFRSESGKYYQNSKNIDYTKAKPIFLHIHMRCECNNNRQSSHWLLAVIWFRIHFTGSGPFFAMAKQQKQIKKMMDIFFVLLVKREYLYECTRSCRRNGVYVSYSYAENTKNDSIILASGQHQSQKQQ